MALILTRDGLDALSTAESTGTKLIATHMAVGDGGGSAVAHTSQSTGLVNEVWRGELNQIVSVIPGEVEFIGHVPLTVGGWYVREVAIYSDSTLLAIGTHPELWKPDPDAPDKLEMEITASVKFSNTELVEMTVDVSKVLASKEYVEDRLADLAYGGATLIEGEINQHPDYNHDLNNLIDLGPWLILEGDENSPLAVDGTVIVYPGDRNERVQVVLADSGLREFRRYSPNRGTDWSAWKDWSIKEATITQAGVVLLATNAELTAGTNDAKVVTPLKLQNRLNALIATEDNLGLIRLVTQDIAEAGTNATRAMTPQGVQQWFEALALPTDEVRGPALVALLEQALTGTNNTRMMTPLRSAALISSLIEELVYNGGQPLLSTLSSGSLQPYPDYDNDLNSMKQAGLYPYWGTDANAPSGADGIVQVYHDSEVGHLMQKARPMTSVREFQRYTINSGAAWINWQDLSKYEATVDTAGVAAIATSAEALAKTDNSKIMTSVKVNLQITDTISTLGLTDGQVTQKGSRSGVGAWTLTGLAVGKPLFLTFSSEFAGAVNAGFRIASGAANIPTDDGSYQVISSGEGGVAVNCGLVVPTSTTVVIEVIVVTESTNLLAFQ